LYYLEICKLKEGINCT